jgi:hypothetical protein
MRSLVLEALSALALVAVITAAPGRPATRPGQSSDAAARVVERTTAAQDAAALDARDLLLALTRAPRLPGSPAEREAAERCRAVLSAAGLEVEESLLPTSVHLPIRQDLQVFAGPNEPLAVLERYEAFDWSALPTWPLPPVYWNTPSADVRGPVVDAGAGTALDYERLATQRVEVRDCVVLVRSSAPPGTLAREAEAHGARALLVSVPRRSGVATWPEGPWASDRQLAGGEVLGRKLPMAPIRAAEADAIATRLRARRVRGTDGTTVTVQVGPGPVEVRLALDVPKHDVERIVLVARTPGADIAQQVAVYAPLATLGTDALAAAETVTALLIARDPARPENLALILGFRPSGMIFKQEASVLQPLTDTFEAPPPRGRELGALLAYETDLAGTAADGFTLVDRFLDPGQARIRAVARAVASTDFVTELRQLPWVPVPAALPADAPSPVSSPR